MTQPLGVDVSALAPEEVVRRHAQKLLRSLPQLNDVVHLAAELAGTPASAVNLVHANGQEAIASWGVEPSTCDIEDSMCRRSVTEGGPVIVADARLDPRFADNAWVTGELGLVRFYCAHPLRTPEGTVFGTLCVWDEREHDLGKPALRRLQALAQHVEELLDVGGHGLGLTSAVEDLTEEHRELRRSNELLTQFAGQVAHDLKAPMTALRLTVGMLAELPSVASDPATRPLLERVGTANDRMDALVSGFLSLASLGGRLSWEPVDLGDVLREVLEDLGPLTAQHKVRTGRMPVVRGDRMQLHAMLLNLVTNAVKFSASAERPVLRISGGGAAEVWWCEVADSGEGVPVELREAVFEPLVRADTSVEGLGLGLAACRRIATNHHADIEILDAPEGGALLRVVASPVVPGDLPVGSVLPQQHQ